MQAEVVHAVLLPLCVACWQLSGSLGCATSSTEQQLNEVV
jgi:hypothetical protein